MVNQGSYATNEIPTLPESTMNSPEKPGRAIELPRSFPTPLPGQESPPELIVETPTALPEAREKDPAPKAPEFLGISEWINSEPLRLGGLTGKVVLVDFWTYSCVNCIRTFPYLKLWYEQYADHGLVIVGVHTPEFDFEKDLENVRNAVEKHGISWPVALDNEYFTWETYRNRYWPAKYLIDVNGVVRYTHFGEGAYGEIESNIQMLLLEAGSDISAQGSELPNYPSLDSAYLNNPSVKPTKELYAGQVYLYLGPKGPGGPPNDVVTYRDTGEHQKNLIYLQGPWYNSADSVQHARETADFVDYLVLTYSAKSVNAVIGPRGENADFFKVLVTLDGENVPETSKGEDLVIEDDGSSFLCVDKPRMYSIIQAPRYGTYELKLSSKSPSFTIYTITFGINESGV